MKKRDDDDDENNDERARKDTCFMVQLRLLWTAASQATERHR